MIGMSAPRTRVHWFEEAFDEIVSRHFTQAYGKELTRISEFRFNTNRRKAYDRMFIWHNDVVDNPYLIVEIDEAHHKRNVQIERDYNNIMTCLQENPIHFLRIRDSDFHLLEDIMCLFINFIYISDDNAHLIMLSNDEKYHKLDGMLYTGLTCAGVRFKRTLYGRYVVYCVKIARGIAWDGYGDAADGTKLGCYAK